MSLHNFIVAGTILSSKAKNTDTPKYQKLAAMLRGQTETGQLKSGQKLPPVREMAYQMGISSAQVYVANFVLRHSKLAEIQKMVRDGFRVYVAETVKLLDQFDISWKTDVPMILLTLPGRWHTTAFCSAAEKLGVLVSLGQFLSSESPAPRMLCAYV